MPPVESLFECGVDEVARGCLFGRVYAGAVVWAGDASQTPLPLPAGIVVRDSKTMSHRQRVRATQYVKDHAVAWAVGYREPSEIDRTNILRAAMAAMHDAISSLSVRPASLAIDGTMFIQYDGIPHRCIPQGDRCHFAISCAAIIAKTAHDAYVAELCAADPTLDQRYGLLKNMGYGTATHIRGVREHGVTENHRRTFGVCRTACLAKASDEKNIETESMH